MCKGYEDIVIDNMGGDCFYCKVAQDECSYFTWIQTDDDTEIVRLIYCTIQEKLYISVMHEKNSSVVQF